MREHGIRRYGFHGMSHKFVAGRAATYLKDDYRNLRIINCHLRCETVDMLYGKDHQLTVKSGCPNPGSSPP